MKPTKLLIAGELMRLEENMILPHTHIYLNDYYCRKFIKKLGKALQNKYPNYEVTAGEIDDYYVIRVREMKQCGDN